MDSNENEDDENIEVADVFSPQWNEFYVDGASITVDDYAVRIAFVNHLPQNLISGKRINTTRKVDVVMSEKAFLGLFNVMKQIKDKIDIRNNTTQTDDRE